MFVHVQGVLGRYINSRHTYSIYSTHQLLLYHLLRSRLQIHKSILFLSLVLTIYDMGYVHIYYLTGNALAQVQRVHEPADLWDITFCTRRF